MHKLATYYFLCNVQVFLLAGCFQSEARVDEHEMGERQTLTVYAAASLAEAFHEIETAFEASHAGVDILLNLAGTQQLLQQLKSGAPADVFASANLEKMEEAVSAQLISSGSPKVFARNRLIAILPEDNPARITTLEDLKQPQLKLVLAAEEVPAGQYTRQFLEKADALGKLGADYKNRVLNGTDSFEQNVRAVRTKVALGEADAGVVYFSDVILQNAPVVSTIPIPEEINPIAEYPIAPMVNSASTALANEFIDFLLSEDGQKLIARHGFITRS